MELNIQALKIELRKNVWSQNELARRLNVSKGTVSKVMNGKRKAGRKVVSGIFRTFPQDVLNLLFKEKTQSINR